ncbi:MAG: LysM peptidoglycan-binding domain-containing protein, partial [Actinomycetota bacterium]|nr:LysM peptidoglycan-binding domain-containing protein [Actinomycetota bacterium]
LVGSNAVGEVSVAGPAAQPTPRPQVSSEPSKQAAPGTADTYEVRPGDSLWGIARQRLGTEASAAEIARFVDRLWSLNADVIRSGSPDRILPGEKLRLPQTR